MEFIFVVGIILIAIGLWLILQGPVEYWTNR